MNEPLDTSMNQTFYDKRSTIEQAEAEFALLTRKEQDRFYNVHLERLAFPVEQQIASAILKDKVHIERTTLRERLRKMYLYRITPKEIKVWREFFRTETRRRESAKER